MFFFSSRRRHTSCSGVSWARIAFKQVAKAHKFDRNHVTQIMRATDSREVALEHINTYFEGQSRVYWANALRIVWKETGKASIAVMHDVLTGKVFFSYSAITKTRSETPSCVTLQRRGINSSRTPST